MTDRIETVIATHADYVSGWARHCTCGTWSDTSESAQSSRASWFAHLLAALKAARIAVVELPEVSQEDLYHQYWISIAPNASIKYEYDGSWDSSEHVREFATALLAAADIAEASQ